MLKQLFGDNRAEWPSENFRELFVTPTYINKLETFRPCFLVGGRGTGKTTSLQSLKYDATLERLQAEKMAYEDQEYLGVLVRMNKNRVRAFQGNELSDDLWRRTFAHYFNLLVCLELTSLTKWLIEKNSDIDPSGVVHKVAADFGFAEDDVVDIADLQNKLKLSISRLQIYVNNPSGETKVILSMAEAPVRSFAEELVNSELAGDRVIYCCIDEYENLLDYQQAVLNTYVKHAEPPLSYKVGVRKYGLRNRQTLDGHDLLKVPDDYAEIEIADEGFDYFAKAVANLRLKRASERGVNVPTELYEFLEDLSFYEEASLLGAEKVADSVLEEVKENEEEVFERLHQIPKEKLYFIKYWSDGGNGSVVDLSKNWLDNESLWNNRLNNHGYASLFWLSRGKGVRIHKYYCGERVFLSLAAGNIRYFLELIDAAITIEFENREVNSRTRLSLSPKSQTLAAKEVGRRRLDQLEGLADHGVQLKRLVLAIGKVFFEFARSPVGRTPEVTSFTVGGSQEDREAILALLSEGVGHLAFEAAPRTKATSNFEVKDDEYRLHRIFCGFFEISHRKKRRMTFNANDLLGVLGENPSAAILRMLGGVEQSDEQELPEQLALFNAFYAGGEM
ncbi:MAG: hypothetical protein ABW084_00890 [Candidatus Thiodiazotropha sp.]